MGSEVRIDGETGVDDISAGAGDAPGVGALAAQRIDAARVWAAAWNPTKEQATGALSPQLGFAPPVRAVN